MESIPLCSVTLSRHGPESRLLRLKSIRCVMPKIIALFLWTIDGLIAMTNRYFDIGRTSNSETFESIYMIVKLAEQAAATSYYYHYFDSHKIFLSIATTSPSQSQKHGQGLTPDKLIPLKKRYPTLGRAKLAKIFGINWLPDHSTRHAIIIHTFSYPESFIKKKNTLTTMRINHASNKYICLYIYRNGNGSPCICRLAWPITRVLCFLPLFLTLAFIISPVPPSATSL